MKKVDYENLKIGDICMIKRGHDKGKKCEVLWKENETVLLRCLDETFKTITHTNKNFRLTNVREIDTYSI